MTTVKISKTLVKQCTDLLPEQGIGGAVELAVEAYLELRKFYVHTLRGVFTRQELTALVDMFNGHLLERFYQTSSEVLLHSMEEAERYENTFSRHNADLQAASEKVEELEVAQVFFLQEICKWFWLQTDTEQGMTLEQFFETYAKKE